jgi:hypothetical protein
MRRFDGKLETRNPLNELRVLCVSVVQSHFIAKCDCACGAVAEKGPERRFWALRARSDATGSATLGATWRGESHHVDEGEKS